MQIAKIRNVRINVKENKNHKVAIWGNAMSITDHKPQTYAKDLTLRYPIYCPFDGNNIELTFDNYCGLEPIEITSATILYDDIFYEMTFDGCNSTTVKTGMAVKTDPLNIEVRKDKTITVSFYLGNYTLMRSSVVALGPLSSGIYAVGNQTKVKDIPINISRKTDVFFFLSNVSIETSVENRAIVCYGDSITAQDWPDYLKLRCKELGYNHTAIIRRATSGSRILREYNNITYESYGLKGTNRFEHEVPTDGADTVIIQQGINDIIHPVGLEVNPFRPMSDLPTVDEMIDGMKWYIEKARSYGYKVYAGTLIPIEGWRTYADFREKMKNEFNDWIRTTDLIDGCIDFDKAIRDISNPKSFAKGYDSGDHLHPSHEGYKRMAWEVPDEILR